MANILLRDISDELYHRVQSAAQASRRSVPAEVIVMVEQQLAQRELLHTRQQVLAQVDRRWEKEDALHADAGEWLREDRNR